MLNQARSPRVASFVGLHATYLIIVPPLAALLGCGSEILPDPNQQVQTGETARREIYRWAAIGRGHQDQLPGSVFPKSAGNFWFYEGGSFSGSIIYGTFTCGTKEDCLKAVEWLGNLRASELGPWKPSRYAVVMEGLPYYFKDHKTIPIKSNPWNVRTIKNGFVYEEVRGDHQNMVYYAIDTDKNRVYFHYESGGFPAEEYRNESGR